MFHKICGSSLRELLIVKNLDKIITEISEKIEQEAMDRAELIPPSQRPKVIITEQDAIKDELEFFDLDTEIDKIITAEEKSVPQPDIKKEI